LTAHDLVPFSGTAYIDTLNFQRWLSSIDAIQTPQVFGRTHLAFLKPSNYAIIHGCEYFRTPSMIRLDFEKSHQCIHPFRLFVLISSNVTKGFTAVRQIKHISLICLLSAWRVASPAPPKQGHHRFRITSARKRARSRYGGCAEPWGERALLACDRPRRADSDESEVNQRSSLQSAQLGSLARARSLSL
jgi:hypothetical protein